MRRKKLRAKKDLSDEAAEFLRDLSRFLEVLIRHIEAESQSSKQDGPGGIRTHGHPVMSRALHH